MYYDRWIDYLYYNVAIVCLMKGFLKIATVVIIQLLQSRKKIEINIIISGRREEQKKKYPIVKRASILTTFWLVPLKIIESHDWY